VRRELHRLAVPFREPWVTSAGVVSERELLLLRLEDDDGAVGHGEAAPFAPYDGVALDDVAQALLHPGADALPAQARAAVEMARLDLEARREDRAVGVPGADAIAVNRTLGAGPVEEVVLRAAQGLKDGYSCFKLKVGLPDDLERVAAVREAVGPWPALRLDANGAWSAAEAVEALSALVPYDLEWVEQPCRTLAELAEVRRALPGLLVAADEPISSSADVRAAAALEACDVVCVKLAPSGGYCGARDALRAAGEAGLQACLSSTLDGPWGIAAALQLAASERLFLACGLATLDLFDGPLASALPPPVAGLMAVPAGPGLGVGLDARELDAVLLEEAL